VPVIDNIVKVFIPAAISFFLGIGLTFPISRYLYAKELWKKKAGKVAPDGSATPIFNKLHEHKEVGTPKLGGTVIWLSTFITVTAIWLGAKMLPIEFLEKLDFLSRNQTWIPLATLLVGAFIGLIDDLMDIRGNGTHIAGGLSLKHRILIVALVSLLCGLWFYTKLDVRTIGIPFAGDVPIGALVIPLFVIVTVAVYSGGIIDGLDGLAGGIFAIIFSAYSIIAFNQGQINLAAFCATLVGAILAFLWFNIPPARFYMSETGSMALTVTLAVVAFMTDSLGEGHGVIALPIIALPLVVTTLSVILQLLSKKFRGGKKIFVVAPLHHHFEAKGWPPYKITMRYWVISVIVALLGMILAFIGR